MYHVRLILSQELTSLGYKPCNIKNAAEVEKKTENDKKILILSLILSSLNILITKYEIQIYFLQIKYYLGSICDNRNTFQLQVFFAESD